jgi:hypothetical protein
MTDAVLGIDVSKKAVVQTFGINAMKRSGTLRGSCRENSIPNFGRSFAVDAKLAKFELTFPAMPAMVIEALRKRFNPSMDDNSLRF